MSKYDSPDYEVILDDGVYEIRNYSDFLMVEYEDYNDPDIQNGFNTLFSYISGENRESEKIQMTVPVIEEIKENSKKIAFVVPHKLWDSVPQPVSADLSVRKFEGGKIAAIQYSGLPSESKIANEIKLLSTWLESHGYKIKLPFFLAYYNGPFTLPMLRRNEVLVRVVSGQE